MAKVRAYISLHIDLEGKELEQLIQRLNGELDPDEESDEVFEYFDEERKSAGWKWEIVEE
jgi:hypothetical protein